MSSKLSLLPHAEAGPPRHAPRIDKQTVPDGNTFGWNNGGVNLPRRAGSQCLASLIHRAALLSYPLPESPTHILGACLGSRLERLIAACTGRLASSSIEAGGKIEE